MNGVLAFTKEKDAFWKGEKRWAGNIPEIQHSVNSEEASRKTSKVISKQRVLNYQGDYT